MTDAIDDRSRVDASLADVVEVKCLRGFVGAVLDVVLVLVEATESLADVRTELATD